MSSPLEVVWTKLVDLATSGLIVAWLILTPVILLVAASSVR